MNPNPQYMIRFWKWQASSFPSVKTVFLETHEAVLKTLKENAYNKYADYRELHHTPPADQGGKRWELWKRLHICKGYRLLSYHKKSPRQGAHVYVHLSKFDEYHGDPNRPDLDILPSSNLDVLKASEIKSLNA